jgi:Na+-driven multidrug efflux pump
MPLAWTISIGSAFRASGHMRQPAIAIAISAISGALLAALLIPQYGLAGAGAAASASYITSLIYIVAAWHRHPPIHLTWHDRIKISAIIKIGLPVAASNAIVPLAFSAMLGMASKFGNHSIAALGITGRIETFALILISAMCSALMPVISQNHGANAKDRTNTAIKTGFFASAAIGIMLGGFLFIFANDIAAIFSKDAEVQAMSSQFLRATWHGSHWR